MAREYLVTVGLHQQTVAGSVTLGVQHEHVYELTATAPATVTLDGFPGAQVAIVWAGPAGTVEGQAVADGETWVAVALSGGWSMYHVGAQNLIPVTPLSPVWFADTENGGGSWSTIPQTGVVWSEQSGTASPGENVTLLASAAAGYVISGQSVWSYEFPVAPEEFESGITHFVAADGSPVTSLTVGGLPIVAPVSGETGGNAIEAASVLSETMSGRGGAMVVAPADDVRMSIAVAPGTSLVVAYLIARGETIVEYRNSGLKVQGTSVSATVPADQRNVVSLEVIGSNGVLYLNGTSVWSGALTFADPSSRRFGAYTYDHLILSMKIEKATGGMAAPSIPASYTTGAIGSDTFSGSDAASVTGRELDNLAGGSAYMSWLSRGDGGWVAPAIGVTSQQGVASGDAGTLVSSVLVKADAPTVRGTLARVPAAGTAYLFTQATRSDPQNGPHLRVTPTAVTPYLQSNTTAGASLGAPQAGDVLEVAVTAAGSATFRLIRGGATIGEVTGTRSTPSAGAPFSGVGVRDNADPIWDDLRWSVTP